MELALLKNIKTQTCFISNDISTIVALKYFLVTYGYFFPAKKNLKRF